MNMKQWPTTGSLRSAIPVGIFGGLICVLLAVAWIALSAIGERRASVQAAENMLAQLEGRSLHGGGDGRSPLGDAPAGSVFLEGQTLTVAGAALLQRVGGAVNRIGGNILSSQVELQKADSKDGWIGLVVSCEIEQGSLQQLLYDLEAGMPFLFIDQLVVQAPVAGVEKSQTKILLSVSGLWGGSK
jgi:general secretion pathway protein M